MRERWIWKVVFGRMAGVTVRPRVRRADGGRTGRGVDRSVLAGHERGVSTGVRGRSPDRHHPQYARAHAGELGPALRLLRRLDRPVHHETAQRGAGARTGSHECDQAAYAGIGPRQARVLHRDLPRRPVSPPRPPRDRYGLAPRLDQHGRSPGRAGRNHAPEARRAGQAGSATAKMSRAQCPPHAPLRRLPSRREPTERENAGAQASLRERRLFRRHHRSRQRQRRLRRAPSI